MLNCKFCGVGFDKKGLKVFCSRKCNIDYWHKYDKIKRNSSVEEKAKKAARSRAWYRRKMGLDVDAPLMCGKKGDGYITSTGYKLINKKGHPNSQKKGAIFEHVFIMSAHIGRPLIKGETVHHKNGIRNDNRIKNLELWSSRQCKGQRVEDKIEWCKEFLAQYGYRVIIENELTESN